MYYTFKSTDKGYIGKAFEMTIKQALNRKNADRVSAQGKTDLIFHHRYYDAKQNGTVLRYADSSRFISGSRRVIYASHVSYDAIAIDADHISVSIHLADTDLYVVDRDEFVEFLLNNGMAKNNVARGEINIQTLYNYRKDAYHGKKGKVIEQWCADHDLDDDIIGYILQGIDD